MDRLARIFATAGFVMSPAVRDLMGLRLTANVTRGRRRARRAARRAGDAARLPPGRVQRVRRLARGAAAAAMRGHDLAGRRVRRLRHPTALIRSLTLDPRDPLNSRPRW
jgi:hypothetical protein